MPPRPPSPSNRSPRRRPGPAMPGWLWMVLLASILLMLFVFPFDNPPTIDYSEFKTFFRENALDHGLVTARAPDSGGQSLLPAGGRKIVNEAYDGVALFERQLRSGRLDLGSHFVAEAGVHRKRQVQDFIQGARVMGYLIEFAGAQFVELDGNDHWFFAGAQQPVLDAIKRFVNALPRDRRPTR